jgi:hypothetical protein
VHFRKAQGHEETVGQRCTASGSVLLAAGVGATEAGTAGFDAVDAGVGLAGGMVSGPFWPQPASVAATRHSGNSKFDRRMAGSAESDNAV